MKAWLKEFGRSVLQKVIILGSIALVVAAIVFLATRPAISASILDTVTLENGRYTLDGLRAGMTRDEVAAQLDERNLVYFDGEPYMYPEGTPAAQKYAAAEDTTWISLSDETRVTELGNATIRRTYYFRDGLLTHIDLETDVTKGSVEDDIERFYALLDVLEEAYGEGTGSHTIVSLEKPGTVSQSWYGADETEITVIGRRYEVEDWVKEYGQTESTYTDFFEAVIRIKV